MTATSFKELMGQLKEDTTVQVAAADKKNLQIITTSLKDGTTHSKH